MAWYRSILLAVAVAVAVLAASALVVAPASAQPETERVGDHWPVSVTTTVPAGGGSMITTPTLGKDVKTLKVTVKPQSGSTDEELDAFDQFLNTMGTLSKGKRLLTCVMMYQRFAHIRSDNGYDLDFSAGHLSIAGAVLLACLQMAGLLQSEGSPRALTARGAAAPSALAGRGCDQIRPSIPATVEKTDDGYTVHADGTTKKARKQKYRVGCRVKGNKFTYNIRAAKKGVPLRRVLGKKIRVGIQSPPDASTSVPVKVTFDVP